MLSGLSPFVSDMQMPDKKPPIDSRKDVDWGQISARYQDLLSLLQLFRVPADQEIREFDSGLLVGMTQTEGRLFEKCDLGLFLYPGAGPWMARAKELSNEIHCTDEEQESSHGYLEVMDWRKEIEVAIESQKMTMEFLDAWWHFGALFGRAAELDELSELSQISKRAQISSGRKADNSARKVWYARFLTERGVYIRKNGPGLERALLDLNDLCGKIFKGELKSPVKPEFLTRIGFGPSCVSRVMMSLA